MRVEYEHISEPDISTEMVVEMISNSKGDNWRKMNPTFDVLDEPRFIRIAFFDHPDEGRYYNGLAAQLTGNDMYGGVVLLKTLEDDGRYPELTAPGTYSVCCEWEWNGGEDLKGNILLEAKALYKQFLINLVACNKDAPQLEKEELEKSEEIER